VAVEVLGAVTGATGAAGDGVGATEARGAWTGRWWAGADTTTLSAGGALEIPPVEGRCKVPESRNRAIAPAPRSSGIATSAARRAMRASCPMITSPAAAAPDYAIPLPKHLPRPPREIQESPMQFNTPSGQSAAVSVEV
jgi:hypothetical protein